MVYPMLVCEGTRNYGESAAAREVIRLTRGLPVESVRDELVRATRRTEAGLRTIAFYLAEMQERGLHQLLGFASAVHFARERLEMSRRQARDLVAAGSALAELPKTDEAFRESRLSWSKTRLLAKIATPLTEGAWLERALALTVRELEAEILTSEKGRPPRGNRRGLPKVRLKLNLRVDAVTHELWETTRRKLGAEAGESLKDAEVLRIALDRVLRMPAPQACLGGPECEDLCQGHGRIGADDSAFRVSVTQCPTCRDASLLTDDGPVPLTEAQAAAIECDQLDPDQKTSERLRNRILARDGYRCVSCQSRDCLMVHHVVYRSRGGKSVGSNLATVCARCHALVHENLLRIEGTAPYELRFLDRDGESIVGRRAGGGDPDPAIVIDPLDAASSGGARAPLVAVSAAEPLPATIDASWWAAHSNRFSWNERRQVLELSDDPASPAEPVPDEPPPAPRPALDTLIGQAPVVADLKTAVAAAQVADRPVPHTLLVGPPGLGKSTIARALADEIGSRLHATSGPALFDIMTLIGLLAHVRGT